MAAARLDERVAFPAELPITARLGEIADALLAHQVVIVAGETGSGKTTQLPKLCYAMGRGRDGRQIACTQPRRIAATSVAARVAQELQSELGELVGYKVRFNDRVKRTSAIKFVTDGMLLAECQGDAMLRAYDTIILDEAHERSLNIDFLLGYLKRLLPRRPDLRIIVSSATLETERFSAFFDNAPIISVSGRTFPVDVIYRPPREDEGDLADAVANAVNEIVELDGRARGDILVFLPGEREIRDAMTELEQRAIPHTVILPLYARLSAQEQQRVFHTLPQRRVVLATNVAETSLTIPGIVYVVDAGVARVNRYSVRTGVTQLLVEDVSRASADQRKGRCGRTQHGVCFRLYEEHDYTSRPSHTDPEIKRVGLAAVILRMIALGLGDVEDFPFLDPPQKRAVDEGYRVLEELGALDDRRALTDIGAQLGRLPIDPRLGRMILGARAENALREVVIIAAVLGLQDPRDRPQAVQQKADEAHAKFRTETSDFLGYLKMWAFWQDIAGRSKNQRFKACRETFLNFNRMREWEDIHDQLVRVMKEMEFRPNPQPASEDQIHRALLPGLLSKIGMWNPETRVYAGARQMHFKIHPSSGVAKKPPAWVMAAELVETTALYARGVAKIDPLWLDGVAQHLVRRNYGDPHWEQKPAQVVAKENVTLYGLPIIGRKVNYGAIDPTTSREIFITHALVRGEYATKGAFMAANQALLAEVARIRDKARKSDMLADEPALAEFFERVIPRDVVSGKTFEDWRRTAEPKQPKLLHLSLADILLEESHELSAERYPDQIQKLAASYRFEPGEEDDGITLTVPLAMLPQLDPEVLAWTIPGWHETKLRALLDSLPKAMRRTLAERGGHLDELASELARLTKPFAGAMLPAVERAIYERTGERVAREAWDLVSIPAYLGFGYRVVDDKDKVLGAGKDLGELQRVLGGRARELWQQSAPRERYEKTGLRAFDLDELPEFVEITLAGKRVKAFPALVETEAAVDLRLLESADAATRATRDGLRRLLVVALGSTYGKLESQCGPQPAIGTRRAIVQRALDDTFGLTNDPASYPRTRAQFAARVATGRPVFAEALARAAKLAADLGTELDRVRGLMKPLAGRPGITRTAVEDIQSQLAHVLPDNALGAFTPARLVHVQRYLRAIHLRLQRLTHDPVKDQQKAVAVAPLWQKYLARREELRAKGRALGDIDEFGWLVEEFRVQTFAPELKTAVPVSPARLAEYWDVFSR